MIYFHATAASCVAGIREHGLLANNRDYPTPRVYLAESWFDAYTIIRQKHDEMGVDDTIVVLTVNACDDWNLIPDEDCDCPAFYVEHDIPARRLSFPTNDDE